MSVKVQIVFHSLYTHVFRLAEAVAEGARSVDGTEVLMAQVAETLPHEVLEKMGALEAKKVFAHVPVADPHTLPDADAIILGTPTRFGASTAQMQAFLDATGGHWAKGGADRQARQRLHLDREPARRPGNDTRPFAHIFLPSGHGRHRRSLRGAGTVEPGRDQRRVALRRLDDRRAARRALAHAQRAGHRPLPGKPRRQARREARRALTAE